MRGGDRGEQSQGELRDVQIGLGDKRRQLSQDWGEGRQVEAARVVLHQGVQQHKGGELEGTLVLSVCEILCCDDKALTTLWNIYLKKEDKTGRESLSMQRRSILSGELAIAIKALTAVNLVISFLNRSRKMGKQEESSACNESPRCATT